MLLRNHGLHIEILIDPDSPVGSTDAAGIKDVVLESAITTIMDFEDSVPRSTPTTRCSATATGSA